ncbi:RNA polymerase II transcription initiation/nucleotide excision repair factor TFIIH [Pleurostoma richardsiae]|uniref:RNA polymerase II transcription initiation/nucleotide excision repair factor TFIIH n=1 Tax=Pleurostoma richardsiae TaxID=41990 RepID=A0AA38VX16_9PEZI|nr:RNA polymerase II transcription initiation/nucleotide excision repair factor TFIIH [Pleurostoma richardsiae]
MRLASSNLAPSLSFSLASILVPVAAAPSSGQLKRGLTDTEYLPAQIGGIVGSYALSLVLVAIVLLILAKKRRERLNALEEEEAGLGGADFIRERFSAYIPYQPGQPSGQLPGQHIPYPLQIPKSGVPNFSYPSPTSPSFNRDQNPYIYPSPISSLGAPGIDCNVDQTIVARDRKMAQSQLEEMYKYVMEQEAAKEAGVDFKPPIMGVPTQNKSSSTLTKKERNKPANLNLGSEKKESRVSSILSALKSPRQKKLQGVSISSPIMTPMSGTFPRQDGEEMNPIPPRHYAPPRPPPIPTDQHPYSQRRTGPVSPITPDISPQSTQSIDERIGAQNCLPQGHARNVSSATSEVDPVSAVSDTSQTPLVGLPSSPKPGVTRFPSLASLPSSPKPGATFSRANAPSAIRADGSLPLRAYEPSLASPTSSAAHTKQTVFERTGPLSPGPNTARTPWTGAPVPYSPYQPYTPVIPMTPSLVTKADRKRMKKFEPKTPTLEMVKSSEEIW